MPIMGKDFAFYKQVPEKNQINTTNFLLILN